MVKISKLNPDLVFDIRTRLWSKVRSLGKILNKIDWKLPEIKMFGNKKLTFKKLYTTVECFKGLGNLRVQNNLFFWSNQLLSKSITSF